jgi:hypothetical protein
VLPGKLKAFSLNPQKNVMLPPLPKKHVNLTWGIGKVLNQEHSIALLVSSGALLVTTEAALSASGG